MKVLLILNDPPYGTEKSYNALRLAMTLQKEQSTVEMLVFLMADAASCAVPNQITPPGYYNLERMLRAIMDKGGQVKACGTCLEARGLKEIALLAGVEASTMSQLAQWTLIADKVLTF